MNLKLREYRRLAGLNQLQMADALDVKVATYRTWENEKRKLTFENACACADILNCTLDELAGRKSRKAFADPRQEQLNESFEIMDDISKDAAVAAMKGMAAGSSKSASRTPNSIPTPKVA